MAIANPILTTAVTLGATTTSLTKIKDGEYTYVNPTGQIPTTLSIKPAASSGSSPKISMTLRRNPGILDAYPDQPAGSLSASFQLSGRLGSVVTRDVLQDFAVELASLAATPALIDALLLGSVL